MRLTFLAACAAALLCTVPASALAARPAAAGDEHHAITQAAFEGEVDDHCSTVTVSTADATWAAARFAAVDGCPEGDGVAVVRHDGELWLQAAVGSDLGLCRDAGIPDAVGRDLGVCATPSATVGALLVGVNANGMKLHLRPRSYIDGVRAEVTGLRWSRWNADRAVGRGRYTYFTSVNEERQGKRMLRLPITVTFFAPTVCANGQRIFTRQRVKAVRSRDRRKLYGASLPLPGCSALYALGR